MSATTTRPARVVVLGGGFGGLYATLTLLKELADSELAEVTLVDRRNYFTFTPLLPELAAGTLGASHVCYPFRSLSKRGRLHFIQGEVREFGLDEHVIWIENLAVPYDYLVVALGSAPSFFGNHQLESHGLTLTSVADSLAIRNHVIRLFERAAVEHNPVRRRELLTVAVAGAGPSGVEIVAELHHLIHSTLLKYYPVDASEVRMLLVDGGDHILPHFARALTGTGQTLLVKRGIDVRLKTRVTGAGADYVELNGGEEIVPTRTLIWTGGTAPSSALTRLPAAKTRRGAVLVDEFLRLPDHPEVYVIGDGSHVMDRRHERPYPPVAPVAIREGIRAAANIVNALEGRAGEPFQFDFTGNIVGLGGGMALVNFLGITFHGRLGWWVYRIAYLLRLVGAKNKALLVLTLGLNALFDRDISCETLPERAVCLGGEISGDAGSGDTTSAPGGGESSQGLRGATRERFAPPGVCTGGANESSPEATL